MSNNNKFNPISLNKFQQQLQQQNKAFLTAFKKQWNKNQQK